MPRKYSRTPLNVALHGSGILSGDIKHPSGHHPGKGTKDFFLALQNLEDGAW
jgi:hypothetical protein